MITMTQPETAAVAAVNNEENALEKIEVHGRPNARNLKMDYQEEFYKERLKLIHEPRNDRGEIFEKMQQEKLEKIKVYMENPSSAKDRQFRFEQGATLILSQQKAMDNFADEWDKLIKDLDARKAELMRQWNEEEVKLEKEFDEELARLMEKYSGTS